MQTFYISRYFLLEGSFVQTFNNPLSLSSSSFAFSFWWLSTRVIVWFGYEMRLSPIGKFSLIAVGICYGRRKQRRICLWLYAWRKTGTLSLFLLLSVALCFFTFHAHSHLLEGYRSLNCFRNVPFTKAQGSLSRRPTGQNVLFDILFILFSERTKYFHDRFSNTVRRYTLKL